MGRNANCTERNSKINFQNMLVKNKKTGVESKMTEEQWKKTQANPLWAGVFVPVISEPKEVQKLKESKATVDKPTTTTTKEVEK